MAEATLLSLTLYKTALAFEAQENVAEIQEKQDEEEIEKMVEGKEDKESYASKFADSMLNDDVDDSGTRIEPMSHKENLEVVANDDVSKKNDDEKYEDEVNDDDVEKVDDAAEEKYNEDHSNHTLVRTHATGSMETGNEQMQTSISTPTRSLRKDLSSDKIILDELTVAASPITATTSKPKIKRGFTSRFKKFLISNNVVLEMTFSRTNGIIKKEMPRLVNLTVNKDRKFDPIYVPKLISKEFATHGPKMIEDLF
nr:hypothetical protein [Tanacetum cinerariifolium]